MPDFNEMVADSLRDQPEGLWEEILEDLVEGFSSTKVEEAMKEATAEQDRYISGKFDEMEVPSRDDVAEVARIEISEQITSFIRISNNGLKLCDLGEAFKEAITLVATEVARKEMAEFFRNMAALYEPAPSSPPMGFEVVGP